MSVAPWLQGINLTAITITGLAKAANGALTAGSAQVITAYVTEVDPSIETDLEDIRPVNAYYRNMVPIGAGATLRIVCLQRSDAANILTTLQTTYSYFQVNWTQGAEVFTYRGVVRRWNGGVKNRGGNPVVLELEPINESDLPNISNT